MGHQHFRSRWVTALIACLSLIPGAVFAQHLTTFETADFSGSGICAFCHSRLSDSVGNDVSNDAHWRSTLMANAAKDPFWQAKIFAEVDLWSGEPAIQQVIQEKCSRCHMGMARYQAMAEGTSKDAIFVLQDFGGFLDPNHRLHAPSMDGVSCTLCHQIQSGNLGTEESFTGRYEIDTATEIPNRVLFGPYRNPLRNPMQWNSSFRPTYHSPGQQLYDSALCGSCHTLFTPALDEFGTQQGEFPEQTTYLEWEHIPFAKTCQDCHLPDAAGAVAISNRPRNLAARSPFGQHHFVGGNSFMVALLRANATELGVTAHDSHLQDTLGRTLAQLQTNTATVATELALDKDTLFVTVDVTNKAGHKLPTGLPSRRAWLHVTVSQGGNPIFESGAWRADGSIAGNAADEDSSAYEPHYQTITAADQVQIYEPIMRDYAPGDEVGAVTYTLLRAYEYAKDNRLLPAGFRKEDAPDDIKVYGAAAGDGDFTGGSDRVVYQVPLNGASGTVTVAVELLYQALSYQFIEDLKAAATDKNLVERFMTFYDAADKTPVTIASASAEITVAVD